MNHVRIYRYLGKTGDSTYYCVVRGKFQVGEHSMGERLGIGENLG